MRKIGILNAVCMILAFSAATAVSSPAQVFETIATFNSDNGNAPTGLLAQGTDGRLYGTTVSGGASYGTVFSTDAEGAITDLFTFCKDELSCFYGDAPGGEIPWSGLVLASNGNFYGTTAYGGAYGGGTVFEITPGGTFTSLYSFGFSNGSAPQGGLVQGSDGNLYGTTSGFENDPGTIFSITPSGSLTTLYTFCSQPDCTDGYQPDAGPIQGTDGNFYGTTNRGGASNYGTVFKITPAGELTTLYSFCSRQNCADGDEPTGSLVQATDGNFYGTTVYGGTQGGGTLFKITAAGQFTLLHTFCSQSNCGDGENPAGGLMQATDGNLYGTAQYGGAGSAGTVFRITTQGKFTTLHALQFGDGAYPDCTLLQAANGKIYGTTEGGYNGTIFKLSLGLASPAAARGVGNSNP